MPVRDSWSTMILRNTCGTVGGKSEGESIGMQGRRGPIWVIPMGLARLGPDHLYDQDLLQDC